LPSLLRQDIAIVATVLFGNADIFNSGLHSNRSRLTKRALSNALLRRYK
jgi:hypothetical protein